MKNLLLKRWAGLMVVFALCLQVWAPAAIAEESELETETETEVEIELISEDPVDDEDIDEEEDESDDDSDLSDVTDDDAVDTLDDLLDDEDNVDEEIDEIIEELLDDVDTEEEAEDLVEEIEEDVADIIEDLEDEAEANPLLRLKIQWRIQQHKAFMLKLKARLIMHYSDLADMIRTEDKGRRLYLLRWGVLRQSGIQRCPGVSRDDVVAAVEAGDTPDCEVTQADYEGMLSVNKGSLDMKKEILFENNDEVTVSSGSSVEWSSHIAGHWDGLLVEYKPGDEEGPVEVTVSIGELNETFTSADAMGVKEIGNGHFIEIRPLALALAGVSDDVQDKIVKNKLEIQDELGKVRIKIRTRHLIRTMDDDDSDDSDELEDLLEEIEEYNFDDLSTDEITAEIEAALTDLTDGASSAQFKNRTEKLKGVFQTTKLKAKVRKFSEDFIPFKDTDDSEWFTKYVAKMKVKGIVSGYKDENGNELGEFRPGNDVTVAEILKIGLETSNNGQSNTTPSLAAALNHWAKAYVARAEELGLDIVGDGTDLNRPATRGEVIRMMLEAAGIEPDAVSATSFSDVPPGHKHAAFVEFANELGIVSGDDNATTFRPNAPINRAEVSKVANQIIEILLGE